MSHKVSVVMPARNMARYLAQAVESIQRQPVPVHEILIADQGSTDETRSVIRRLQCLGAPIVTLAADGARAPGETRNVALAAADGDVIAFLDADDLWPEDKLFRQLARLDAEPHVDMVSGYVTYCEEIDPATLAPVSGSKVETLFHAHLGCAIYRRSVFDRVGLFDADLRFGEDVDLLLRVRETGIPFTILRAVTLYYRRHPDSMMSGTESRKQSDFRLAVLKSIRRRRAAGLPALDLPAFASFVEDEECR